MMNTKHQNFTNVDSRNYYHRQDSFDSQCSSLGRSPSFCSTCSSRAYNTDSEEEDASTRWPWIEHIQDNGDLVYIQSQNENQIPRNYKDHVRTIVNNENKEKRIQEKIKSVIKKSRSFSKKDYINRINNSDNNEKNKVHRHHPHHNKKKPSQTDIQKAQDFKSVHMDTKISDTTNLICKNVAVTLNAAIEENYVTLENVLGVITGLDMDPVLDDFNNDIMFSGIPGFKQNANSIIIQGIIPNSPIDRCQNISIGDIILAINGLEVNHSSINQVLLKVNGDSEVIITIERLVTRIISNNKSQLCSIISNKITDHEEMVFDAFNEICCVAYLTLSGTEDKAESDIIFWYPESDRIKKLKSVRGIFLTLSDIMVNVTGANIQSSVLVIDEQVINVRYKNVEDNVFLVSLPQEKCSSLKLDYCINELLHLLILMYGSVGRAFQTENISSSKHIISMFVDHLLQNYEDFMTGVRQLQLPTSHYVDISNVLCDAEAADYGDCIDDFFPHRRLYGTIGTCLFYQDTLVCNHLCDENLRDVVNFCKYHWLFLIAKKEKLRQIVIWKEIFLTAKKAQIKSDFQKPTGVRWFVLVVGKGKSLLCSLLEAGGVASVPEGNPGPHPYYVDTAWSILTYLIESLDFEVISQTRLEGGSSPAVVNPLEAIYPKISQSPRALELIKRKVPAHMDLPSSDVNSSTLYHQQYASFDVSLDVSHASTGRRDSIGSSASSGSIFTNNVVLPPSNEFKMKSLSFSSATEISLTSALSTKLTTGMNNTLFYFTMLKNHSGVLICPNISQSTDALTNEIISSFQASCEKIHELFLPKQCSARQLEYGLLFRVRTTKGAEMKKGSPSVKYWVVGRIVKKGSSEEEVYVCFQDGVAQNIIEMAFKMRYGCYY